ncbi:MAG: [acyl-carrier-protein] S-malonyltransferase [Holophagae bacterium]|nr:MAG: [acyl-carrier-protein] S-malonyltransferase [Holophagae bacterium]
MKLAALFPGQGSQAVGMGRDLAERWAAAREVFEAADRGLGVALSALCWQGPEEALRLTENTQPALLAHSIAAWRVLVAAGIRADAVAGHSLGEYSAVVAAGGLGLEDALAAVRLRGRLMQQAVPVGAGAMAAVLGLDDELVVAACADATAGGEGVVVAANFNSPGQVVIAGDAAAVDRAIARCGELGARRALPLPVSAPFHSPLMAPAREGLEPTLRELRFAPLAFPVYRNVDGAPVASPDEVCDGLIRQVDAPVLWRATVERMRADGFDTFLEVGTGNVLSGLVRRIDRDARCIAAGTVESVEAAIAELVG